MRFCQQKHGRHRAPLLCTGAPNETSCYLCTSELDSSMFFGSFFTGEWVRSAQDKFIPRIVQNQSLPPDATTGATIYSTVIGNCVAQAIDDADKLALVLRRRRAYSASRKYPGSRIHGISSASNLVGG